MSGNDSDGKLEAAARKSPAVAAMLAGMHDHPGPRYRRVAALLAALVVGVGGAWYAASSFSARRAAPGTNEPAAEIDRAEYLLPIKTERASADEETAPFSGFAVSIESDPPGAVVWVAGKMRGEAPVLSNVSCGGAETIEVRAEKPGFRPVRRAVRCRADTLVKLTLRLER
jgi:hypothetical protein